MISADKTAELLTTPPLENGDRLTRAEFERRYHAMSHLKKAELIEGVVYVASPVRAKTHGKPHSRIMGWLVAYEAATPGVETLDNTTVLLDADNEPQPDALLRIEQGGQSRITEDDYVEGAPELIVEIAASSASYDLHEKLKVYRRNQVQEYLVWRVYDRQFDWFRLNEGEYIQLTPNSDDIICSLVFPGLWLAKSALLSGDLAQVLATLEQGLSTPEHQSFVDSYLARLRLKSRLHRQNPPARVPNP
ncbi:Uma2 family endonuclease [Nostoc sp. FACHB-110]|uniref:Uma2 family endonuclease n=1 Tax=Nostoc sp. FACHB-110 TaxID=2692834 RepID=UPI0016841D35|nr:Uma2 family endonuclease [Nostoc sp. FACHB-110]MBD2437526.1 Uma2 family endonuclease [Nostoc sp. FACHB-110]